MDCSESKFWHSRWLLAVSGALTAAGFIMVAARANRLVDRVRDQRWLKANPITYA